MSSADASDPPPSQQGTAEDRKAASALSNLDAPSSVDEASSTSTPANVDHEAVSKAISSKPTATGAAAAGAAAKKSVKVDAADVTLLVDQLEVSKAKATELLKAHDGDAVAALRAVARG
ncbi:hypothetical protein MKX07_004829 [Trichoderma sp. CBMAI-0711]|uniref:Nascent polypeptide-associated complex subunit alpha-like UBA domain-containing protein n=1 Tax=Trichoderma parareesei TaxID=858221 RepID=A0A2H2ZF66_TRIPA|nr:hypothetical protein MKX07_004829 [Trichoderma sp. CBMAI-0711]OTA00916.1 hypothetical protein A9Z42_0012000 [Trichoderma parareesei]